MNDHLRQPPLPTPEAERFRRRQFVAPHRRRRLIFRLAKPFLAAVAIVGLPCTFGAWILLSNQFSVHQIDVTGTSRVSTSWAEQRLEVLAGRQVFFVELGDVEGLVSDHNWVRGVRIRRSLPNRLEVEIVERRPVALVAQGSVLAYLDEDARVIGSYDPSIDAAGLVLMSTPEDRPDLVANGLALLESWRRRHLPFADGLSEISVLTSTDFRVITAGLPFPIFVSSINLAEGLTSLIRYRPQLEDQVARLSPIGAVDLRFRGRIVCQPAAPQPHNLEVETNA